MFQSLKLLSGVGAPWTTKAREDSPSVSRKDFMVTFGDRDAGDRDINM